MIGEPRIETLEGKRLIGLRTTASVAEDGAGELWRAFTPRRRERVGVVSDGLYAVFRHRGPASEGEATYRYIHETWLPASGFVLADRPHFAVMDERYRGEDPDSEEEIWIPVEAGDTGRPD